MKVISTKADGKTVLGIILENEDDRQALLRFAGNNSVSDVLTIINYNNGSSSKKLVDAGTIHKYACIINNDVLCAILGALQK